MKFQRINTTIVTARLTFAAFVFYRHLTHSLATAVNSFNEICSTIPVFALIFHHIVSMSQTLVLPRAGLANSHMLYQLSYRGMISML